MDKPVFILFLSLFPLFGRSQNLVPNGDFEFYTQCPDDYGQLSRAFPWYQPNPESSDYYNACVTAPGMVLDVDVPSNTYGYQFAHSGNGYSGFSPSDDSFSFHEYLATPLVSSLNVGTEYCVSFWLSNADSICLYFNSIGVYFDQDSIFSPIDYIQVAPQFEYTEFIFDKENWFYVEGSFIANGGEKYMAIGLFDTTNLDSTVLCNDPFSSSGSYVYIDDVSLTESSKGCGNEIFYVPNVFTPNDDLFNDQWIVKSKSEMVVRILNRWGNIVFEETGQTISWGGNNNSDGIYFYCIEINDELKTGFVQLIR